MITIKAEQEHYCLVTDGGSWTVIERRVGKYYPLGNCSRPGVALDEQEAAVIFREGQCYPEPVARRRLADVATGWRDLLEDGWSVAQANRDNPCAVGLSTSGAGHRTEPNPAAGFSVESRSA